MLASSLSSALAVSAYSERTAQVDDAIERYRKGDAVLSFLDDQGSAIVGAAVSYRQTTRGFLFGLPPQAPDESTWSLLRETGVNYAQMFMSWKLTDDPGFRGWVDYTFTPSFLKRHGIVLLSGHCLVWMVASYPENPAADPMNLPARVMTPKYDELKRELYDHVYETVSHYKSLIRYWGINEPFWPYADPFHLTTTQWLEIVGLSVQAIKKADPTAKIYMNNLLGDVPSWNYYPLKGMKLLIEKGIEFDMIGLEVYGKDRTPGVPSDSNGNPVVQSVSKRLDTWAELGKPIILTEVDVTSEPNEKTRAEWLRDFYAMAFAKPYMKGIAWSFMFDNPWLPKAGIFDCQRQDRYGNCQ
jgi:GH35 family endo-1,4-beta-xylanase